MTRAGRHTYSATVTWTGNKGKGTTAYDAYARDYDIACAGRPTIRGSADVHYLGDVERHNPEVLLVAALSACHMLWYLHLCAVNGVVVAAYDDHAEGLMQMLRRRNARLDGQECARTRWALKLARYRSAYSTAYHKAGVASRV